MRVVNVNRRKAKVIMFEAPRDWSLRFKILADNELNDG